MQVYAAAHAIVGGRVASDVRLTVAHGRFAAVESGAAPVPGDIVLPGVVLPGFANAHSHAFHRAMRGRTHAAGDFWAWRREAYAVACRLDPDSYLALATAVYAEMALAGVTCVGEFHYLHSHPEMGAALVSAARAAGIRLTLLDTAYLAGGLEASGHLPLDDVQRLFAGRSPVADGPGVRSGGAIHSVRAVPRDAIPDVVAEFDGRPLHVHLSEQPAENEACLAFYGATPTQLLAEAGALGPLTTAVHATHLTAADIGLLAHTGTAVCASPSTERDLGDGLGPFAALADAGVPLCVGTDQHVAVDLLAEARDVEMHSRLATGRRGRFGAADLSAMLTENGHRSLGWPDAGRLEAGARADLVAVRLDTVRTAGLAPEQVLFAATAADVHTVVVDGREIVRDGRHVLGDVAALLRRAITAVTDPLPR